MPSHTVVIRSCRLPTTSKGFKMGSTISTRILKLASVAICFLAWSSNPVFADVDFDWVTVGNPGNAPDQLYVEPNNPNNLRYGAVNYTYQISKYEVTNAQYAEFLNKVAASDPNDLFHPNMDISRSGGSGSYTYSAMASFEAKPVTDVSFFDAMRFVNWLQNGQGTGGTESGVYTIGNGLNETRDVTATYFLPSEDEWYKAAYYDPRSEAAGGPPGDDNYWFYPTKNDTTPTAESPIGGMNSANRANAVGSTTDVGAYLFSSSYYGTFDQGGNVREWTENIVFNARGIPGGDWLDSAPSLLSASFRDNAPPTIQNLAIGFRVAGRVLVPNSDPIADAGPDQNIACTNANGELVTLDGTGSSDPDGDPLTYQWNVPASIVLDDPTSATPMGLFPIGITLATLTVTDGNGGLDVDDVEITVADTVPPEVACTTDIMALWPPNHNMENIQVFVDATDNCTNPDNLILLSVTAASSEPDDAPGGGDGKTTGDVNGADGFTAPVDVTSLFAYNASTASFEGTISLRAERAGSGSGRTYSITADVVDTSGNLATTSCVVVVPHNKSGK